jgi:exodeoxyribonuclease V alpha subunit
MENQTLRGRVVRVFYCNPDSPFAAGEIELSDGVKHRFGGKVVANIGDTIELTGKFGRHPKYGPQFEVETGRTHLDETPDSLAHLLAAHEAFAGIGPARAKKIVDEAQLVSDNGDFAEALARHTDAIAARAKVPVALVEKAAEIWSEKREHFGALASIIDFGWSASQAHAILAHFEEASQALHLCQSSPYDLIGSVPRFGFRTVDTVATKNGVEKTDNSRLGAGVCYCLDRIAENGHTWITREGLIDESVRELNIDSLKVEAQVEEVLETLIETGAVFEMEHPENSEQIVFDASLHRFERDVFMDLRERMGRQPDHELPREISSADPDRYAEIFSLLNTGQTEAVLGALTSSFSVFSGGAGTGKTYTVRALCELFTLAGMSVALCAPTGKAAKRLEQATGRDASTIHRLLTPIYDPQSGGFQFLHGPADPIEVDVVVVDEVSMVDVRLMARLLSAVRTKSRIIFVGDHNQIPSVGPGAILRDILGLRESHRRSIHVLTDVVRQAGDLARNTVALLDGVVSTKTTPDWGLSLVKGGDFGGVASEVSGLVDFVCHEPIEPFKRQLDLAWDVQVLAPMRKGKMGTYALNVELQKLRQRMLGNPPPPPTEPDRRPKPLPGDRIIWTKNDYELGLFNGTQAIVKQILKGGAMKIETEDRQEFMIPSSKRDRVELAYAMTIHKSQGSEWPFVILCVSSLHHFMRDRNLLYTGASRASQSLTLLGDMKGIQTYARASASEQRRTLGGLIIPGLNAGTSVL